MKLKLFFQISLYFLIQINHQTKAKAVLTIHILNYKNHANLKHDGNKCETFDWASDHCDPMFQICVTARNPCDILNKKVDHWKNTKTLFTVLSQRIDLQRMERKLSVIVQVDDHDRFDAPDHIAIFTAKFQIKSLNVLYKQKMQIKPKNLDVSLQTSLIIKCANSYYGDNCEKNSNQCEKKCIHGKCSFNFEQNQEVCKCFKDWFGTNCDTFQSKNCSLLNCKKICKETEDVKICTCDHDKGGSMKCVEKIKQRYLFTETLTTTISTISKTLKSIQTKIITTRNDEVHVESSTKITPQSQKLSDINKDYKMEKSIQIQPVLVSHLPSTIIIVCLLVLLCVCLISLLMFIRRWQNKRQFNFSTSPQPQRPLPPILFSRSPQSKHKFNYDTEGNPSIVKTNFYKETCTIPYTYSKREDNEFTRNKFEDDIVDIYEQPIIDNMESLTCETDNYDSDKSDAYEIPNKY